MKDSGVISSFGQHFAKTGSMDPKYHQWMLSAFSNRLIADYGIAEESSVATAMQMIDQARQFLTAARIHLQAVGES